MFLTRNQLERSSSFLEKMYSVKLKTLRMLEKIVEFYDTEGYKERIENVRKEISELEVLISIFKRKIESEDLKLLPDESE